MRAAVVVCWKYEDARRVACTSMLVRVSGGQQHVIFSEDDAFIYGLGW